MTPPTVGLALNFYQGGREAIAKGALPAAATVTVVRNERLVKLTVTATSKVYDHVQLLQDNDEPTRPDRAFATLTPYHKGRVDKAKFIAAQKDGTDNRKLQ